MIGTTTTDYMEAWAEAQRQVTAKEKERRELDQIPEWAEPLAPPNPKMPYLKRAA